MEIHTNVSHLLASTSFMKLQRRRCDFNKELEVVLASLRFRHQRKLDGCDLLLDVAGHRHRNVEIDPSILTAVVNNLVLNAKEQYELGGKAGPIEIGITERALGDTLSIGVYVHDYAVGIPEENRGHIFEPEWTTKPNGQGMGLWMVKKLAEAFEGRVVVSSTHGHYSRFEVLFPVAERTGD